MPKSVQRERKKTEETGRGTPVRLHEKKVTPVAFCKENGNGILIASDQNLCQYVHV